jgi:hypothetical protein
MTGIEALSLLKDGKTLRRESWEPHEKCKALDFFGQWVIHTVIEQEDKILDKELDSIFQNSFSLSEGNFDDFFYIPSYLLYILYSIIVSKEYFSI